MNTSRKLRWRRLRMSFLICLTNVIMPDEMLFEDDPVAEEYYDRLPWQAIPTSFTYINHKCINDSIVNQGSCGSCWAASTASVQTMRRCLKGDPELLSIEEHVSCDHVYTSGVTNNGCWGGNPIPAHKYSANPGDVYEKCYGYDHLMVYYPYPPTTCQSRCDDGSPKRRLMSKNPHRVYNVDEIMEEILNNGPVVASIDLHSDFPPKDKLVPYQVKSNSVKRGGHALIIVGWGTYNGVKYWDVVNTYGKKWNQDGKARVRRGSNDMRIESFVSAADVVVEGFDGVAPVPPPETPEPPTPEKPTLTFADNWVKGQIASVKYSGVSNCPLYAGNALVANISGNGNINIYVQLSEGRHNLTCGSITTTFTVIDYHPRFETSAYIVEEGQYIPFSSTVRTGIEQNIYYDNKNFTVSSTSTNVKAILNRNTAQIYTVNTNPILHDTAQITVTKAEVDDGSVLAIINEPLSQYQKGDLIRISVREQFIFSVTAELTSQNGNVVLTQRWNNPENIKYLSTFEITFSGAPEGVFYIFLKADTGRNIRTEEFTVGNAEKECTILKPENNSHVFEKMDLLLVTENCVQQSIYVNGAKVGTVEYNEQILADGLASGTSTLKINQRQIELRVLRQMEFEETTYTGAVNESIRIKVSNLPPQYSVKASIKYSYTNGYFVVVSEEPGSFALEVTSQNVIPNMVISAEILVVGSCILQFNTSQTFLVGNTYYLGSSHCAGNYQVYLPNGSVISSASEFTPVISGDYKVCIENQCSGTFYVYGVKVDLLTTRLEELSAPVSFQYAAGQGTKQLVLELLCKEHEQAISMLVVGNDGDAAEQVVRFHIPEFGCKNAKFRMVDVDRPEVQGTTGQYQPVEEFRLQFE